MSVLGIGELIPRVEIASRITVEYVLRSLKEEVRIPCFKEAHEEAQKAYDEVANRTPWHESYTERDMAMLLTAQRDAFSRTFIKFLAVPENLR